MEKPSNSHWSLKFTRDVEEWNSAFTEHWTLKYHEGRISYKLRVVGDNGEVCRESDIEKEAVPPEVRTGFEEILRDAGAKA